jgi:hypothetical protein
MKKICTNPRASSLIESLRDIGYSFETALADIIDNSITASAKEIEIIANVNDELPSICVVDDGCGMTEEELVEAMRPGCISPLATRKAGDLGRFGLGLKTASFSQCRRLTVVSKKGDTISGARWDLDDVARENDWMLNVLDHAELMEMDCVCHLKISGTIVIWENLDRLIERTSGKNLKDHIYERLDVARNYLGLVFHRFIQGEKPYPKVSLKINGVFVEPFDPFNPRHPATQHFPEEVCRVDGHKVRIQPFILPHHSKCTRTEYEKYAGEGGYLKNQGFYVYRNGRLIIHKTWFRMVKPSQLTQLARVRVDIPTSIDHLWKIDVRKASAQPPFAVKKKMKIIVERISGASGRVYTYKGKKLVGPEIDSIWIRKANHNQIIYEINRKHPLIKHFFEIIGENKAPIFESVLKVVEQCFPVDAFFSDVSENAENMSSGEISEEVLERLLDLTVKYLSDQKIEQDAIFDILKRTDPYRNNMETVRYILEKKGVSNNERGDLERNSGSSTL